MTDTDSTRSRRHSRRKPRTSVRRPNARRRRDSVRARRAEKIVVACGCGKKFRVGGHRAGTSFECRQCGRDVYVARVDVSTRTRAAVLAEIGIEDTDGAALVYDQERKASVRRRRAEREKSRYKCIECAEPIDDPKAAYGSDGLVCDACRAAVVVHRPLGENDPAAGRTAAATAATGKTSLETFTGAEKVPQGSAEARALAYGALFAIGFIGLAQLVVPTAGIVVGWIVPAAVAACGAGLVWSQHRPTGTA